MMNIPIDYQQQRVIVGAGMAMLLIVGITALVWQSRQVRPLVRPQPTEQPPSAPTFEAAGLFVAPTLAPPTTAPQPTSAPAQAPVAAPVQPAQTGRGLGIVPEAPIEVAPSYLQVVAEQAPHSPRGDGQAGPSGGDWVAVPTLAPAQIEVVQQQAPHKVR